jgi:hypothetical protein
VMVPPSIAARWAAAKTNRCGCCRRSAVFARQRGEVDVVGAPGVRRPELLPESRPLAFLGERRS